MSCSHPAYSSSSAHPSEPVLCHVSGSSNAAVHRHHAHRRPLLLQQVRCCCSSCARHKVAATTPLYVIVIISISNILTEYQICFLLFSPKEEEESPSCQDIKFFSFSLIDGYISLVMDTQAQRRQVLILRCIHLWHPREASQLVWLNVVFN